MYFILFCVLLVNGQTSNNLNDRLRIPHTKSEMLDGEKALRFLVVSDRTGGHRNGVFSRAIDKIELLKPEFILSVGDLIEGYTADETEIDRQWDEFDSIVNKASMRFYYVAGNHDYTNAKMANKWKERLGRVYYHFKYKDVLFLCLNSEDDANAYEPAHLGDDQFQYFKEVLDANKNVRWTFVFMHQPLWTYENTGRWNELKQMLDERESTVFAGHVHKYTAYNENDNDYLVLGTTGGISDLRGSPFGEVDHVTWVALTEDKPELANITLDGIKKRDFVTAESKEIFERTARNRPVKILSRFTVDKEAKDTLTISIKNTEKYPLKVNLKAYANPNTVLWNTEINAITRSEKDTLIHVPVKYFDFDNQGGARPISFDLKGEYMGLPKADNSWEEEVLFWPQPKLRIETTKFNINVDGSLSEWEKLPFEIKNDFRDNKHKFHLVEKEDAIYLAISVQDDDVLGVIGRGAIENEGIMISLDYNSVDKSSYNAGNIAALFSGDWSMLNIVPIKQQGSLMNFEKLGTEIEGKYKRTKNGYDAEIKISKSFLEKKQGKDWKNLRVNIRVNDFHQNGDMEFMTWKPDWWSKDNIPGTGMFFRTD